MLYYFRVFERQIGSNKHTVFILFSVMMSVLFEVLAIAYLKDPSLNILASGPYGLIFASFIPFYFDIPVSSRFRVFGMHLTNKSFVYLAGLQLIFSCWKRSLLPGICGILAGSLYRLNLFGIRKIKIPDVVSSFTSRLRWPSGSSSHTSSSGNATRPIPTFPGHHAEGNNPYTVAAAALDPTEASVATLVSMGFDDNSARQALRHAGNDVNAATNILLESQSL